MNSYPWSPDIWVRPLGWLKAESASHPCVEGSAQLLGHHMDRNPQVALFKAVISWLNPELLCTRAGSSYFIHDSVVGDITSVDASV